VAFDRTYGQAVASADIDIGVLFDGPGSSDGSEAQVNAGESAQTQRESFR